MQVLVTVCDHILLNVLFVACCIPIFTIGAAQAGLYNGMRVLQDQEDDSSCLRAFWRGLRSGFGRVTAIWVVTALVMWMSVSCLLYLLTLEQTDPVPLFACLLVLAICMVYQAVLSLFHSRFGCTTAQLIKNVVYIIIADPVRCIAVAVLLWIPGAIFVCMPGLFVKMTVLWVAAYYSVAFGMNLKIMEKPFHMLAEAFEEKEKVLCVGNPLLACCPLYGNNLGRDGACVVVGDISHDVALLALPCQPCGCSDRA